MKLVALGALGTALMLSPVWSLAQQPAAQNPGGTPAGSPNRPLDPRFEHLTKMLSNVKLVGQFTVIGKDGPAAKEEYTIMKVDKLPEGDTWLFHCRIKYGQHDLTLPLPLDVKWADDTPVITLTNFPIPPLGTFSSRVVLHDDKYAGTWRHDNVGGHLFGTIQKVTDTKPAEKGSAPDGAKAVKPPR
jgi:hypothetical protein